MDRRLVDHLVNTSLVSRATMQRHILRASRNKTSVGEELVAAGDLDENQLARSIASCYGYELLDVSHFEASQRALKMLSANTADKNGILPIALGANSDEITVVLYDVESSYEVLETLKLATGKAPIVRVGPRSFVHSAIRHFYFGEPWADRPSPQVQEVDPISEEFILTDPPPEPEPRRERRPSIPPPTPLARVATQQIAVRKPTAPPVVPKPNNDVAQALKDFDAFLDQADIRPSNPHSSDQGAKIDDDWGDIPSGFGSGFEMETPGQANGLGSGFGKGSVFGEFDAAPSHAADGFDLFEPSEAQPTLQETVDLQTRQINRLNQELQSQREVLAALVDMLVEARVLNRKELTKLVRSRRQ